MRNDKRNDLSFLHPKDFQVTCLPKFQSVSDFFVKDLKSLYTKYM